ncbi:Uncharacterised protein [Mycobacteroides abscessus subsp. abscessus]|nr:Uncharacterised protein [Mycobacteroides abscessus subsp. abscessus]
MSARAIRCLRSHRARVSVSPASRYWIHRSSHMAWEIALNARVGVSAFIAMLAAILTRVRPKPLMR